ncbi:restriction endonuclease subunit S [Clostridioides difficile]
MKSKKFKISEVLQWQSQKEINPLKINELTIDSDFSYPFYGQSTINNGIISFETLTQDVLNNKDGKPTILIHSNNQNIVYLETPFYLKDGHGATSVLQSDKLNERNALYIITCIKKVITKKFAYNEKATKIALKNTYIELPITDTEDIDYDFMGAYIHKLEKERIHKLSTYLSSSELDNYKLTLDEYKLLKNPPSFKSYRVGDLFDVHPTKAYKGSNAEIMNENGKNPVLSNTSQNNGIGGYSNLECTEQGGIITFSDTTTADAIFFQPYDFIGYSHVQGLYPYSDKWNEKSLLYFMTAFKKTALLSKFDYATKFNRKIALEFLISLPTSDNCNLDFEYMEKYIRVQEKISIKSVINWENKIIEK